MTLISTVKQLEEFGRTRLSKTFFMRDFLYSEIEGIEGIPNIPDDPELAILAGKKLCELVLEPIQDRFGRLAVRSAYRSCAVNGKGAENNNQYNCAANENNYAAHIWDKRDKEGYMGAMACVVVPAFLDYYHKTGDWTALAWWIHENVPDYANQYYFSRLAAFNIGWSENPSTQKYIRTYVTNPHTGDKKALVLHSHPTENINPKQVYQPFLDTLR